MTARRWSGEATCAALGAIATCLAAAAAYAILRALAFVIFPAADPARVVWSAHAAFFWRAWESFYVGGMVGALVAWGAKSNAVRIARALGRAAPIVAAIVFAQAILIP